MRLFESFPSLCVCDVHSLYDLIPCSRPNYCFFGLFPSVCSNVICVHVI